MEFPFVAQHDLIQRLGRKVLLENLERMLLIRHFETRAEAGYLQGQIGGFFHSYIGQEAIQTAAIQALGQNNWFATSYRCHALALLLGATPMELMAELYGRSTGNALGRGGSMHFYTERLLGGSGIVGGQIPLATGAAFSIKYRSTPNEVAVCFMGEGAVVQGTFHESLNLAALWKLPCIYVIENNHWGMGTAAKRAISVEKIAEAKAPGYGMKGYTVDGSDFFSCFAAFDYIYQQMLQDSSPVLIEMVVERFKGHSVSDPALYRSKDALKLSKEKDPIASMKKVLLAENILEEGEFELMDQRMKQIALDAVKFAEESPWPELSTLEKDVFAPEMEK